MAEGVKKGGKLDDVLFLEEKRRIESFRTNGINFMSDVVCMMLQNHPSFFLCMLAISKIGAIPSFINTNLSEDSLFHCIKIANAKLFMFDPVFEAQVATIKDACYGINTKLVAYGESTFETELPHLNIAPTLTPSVLAPFSDKDTSEDLIRDAQSAEAAYLIYTR